MDTIGVSQTDFLSGEISMTFDLEKARDAAKFDDHMAITMFPLAIAEIERLRAEISEQKGMIWKTQQVKKEQAAQIKELEDALAEERAKVIMLIEKLQLVANDPDWQSKGLKHDFDWYLAESKKQIESSEPEDQRCRRLGEPNGWTDPEGKIGPDARPKCDHAWQAAIEERGYQTCLKCGECRNIEDIPRTAPAWQITEDRVTAIDQGLRFLEWSNAKTGNVETKKRIAILKTMLEEASGKKSRKQI